jgi:hypothetical protein
MRLPRRGLLVTNDRRECGDLIMIQQSQKIAKPVPSKAKESPLLLATNASQKSRWGIIDSPEG